MYFIMKKSIEIFLFFFLSLIAGSVHAQDKEPSSPLSMSGWNLESNPKVRNSSQESGMISYEIEIDTLGNLLSINVLKQTISAELAKKCEDEVRKMHFVKKVNNTVGTSTSKGTITFVFKVN